MFRGTTEAIAPIARHASRPVALANFHEASTARRFTIAPGNLDTESDPQVMAFGATCLQQ
jgi:hypothetical protein